MALRAIIFSGCVAVLAFALAWPAPAWASPLPPPPPKPVSAAEHHPKIDSILEELIQRRVEGLTVAQGFAQRQGIVLEGDRITVVIEPEGQRSENVDQTALRSLGVVVEGRTRRLIRARIRMDRLREVAAVEGVSYIRLPYTPHPGVIGDVISEGVRLTGADSLHLSGVTGQDIKIAILDVGFAGLSEAIASGQLPSSSIAEVKDYTSYLTPESPHGTAVAEIVHEMAPNAKLYLMKIGDEVGLRRAVDDALREGVQIINHSAIWFNTEFGDGTGVISQIADEARSRGVLWVNAAGNHARQHWEGPFQDGDRDGWHEFAPDDETIDINLAVGETVLIYLTWNDWPKSDQDYDLFLYDGQGQRVASSQRVQRADEPRERIYYRVGRAGVYEIAVYAADAPDRPDLEIFVHKYNGNSPLNFEYPVPTGSIPAPGNARGVLTVGAINRTLWEAGPQEPFSSLGPTSDGRIKPDLSGPDGVSNSIYNSFYGTSAAAPHVAGAAALLLSANPLLTADRLQMLLEGGAVDMGAPGKDAVYGSGRLRLQGQGRVQPGACPAEPLDNAAYPPRDLDGDGLCEDVNGNGRDDFDDAVTLARNIDANLVQTHWMDFDFNSNGRADLDDATQRARMVSTITIRTGTQRTVEPLAGLRDRDIVTLTRRGVGVETLPAVALRVFLDRAPQGLAGYRMTLTLTLPGGKGKVGVEGVEFLAFDGAKAVAVEVAPGGHSVSITLSAADLSQRVEAGSGRVELVRVKVELEVQDGGLDLAGLRLRVDRWDDDTGSPAEAAVSFEVEPMEPITVGRETGLEVSDVLLHPNPVMRGGAVRIAVEGEGIEIEGVEVAVYDLAGRRVWRSGLLPGRELTWNLMDDRGRALANGIYLYIVTVKGFDGRTVRSKAKRLVVLR